MAIACDLFEEGLNFQLWLNCYCTHATTKIFSRFPRNFARMICTRVVICIILAYGNVQRTGNAEGLVTRSGAASFSSITELFTLHDIKQPRKWYSASLFSIGQKPVGPVHRMKFPIYKRCSFDKCFEMSLDFQYGARRDNKGTNTERRASTEGEEVGGHCGINK